MKKKKNQSRFLRTEFGQRKIQLPKSLGFLTEIRFHAIVEEQIGNRTVRTIEMKPRSLKSLVELNQFLVEEYETSRKSILALKRSVRTLKNAKPEAPVEVKAIESSLPVDKLFEHKQNIQNFEIEDNKEQLIAEIERLKTVVLEKDLENLRLDYNNQILMTNIAGMPEFRKNKMSCKFFNSEVEAKTDLRSKPFQGGSPQ